MILAIVIVVAIAAIIVFNKTKPAAEVANNNDNIQNNNSDPAAPEAPVNQKNEKADKEAPVKEFSMTSFYEMVDGQPKPQYSLKEMTVNQGDKVRVKVMVTKGAHNFNLDEFNVKADTPLNQEVTVEFTADKAGEFIYYCSMPGHRQNGHWGTLKVLAQ